MLTVTGFFFFWKVSKSVGKGLCKENMSTLSVITTSINESLCILQVLQFLFQLSEYLLLFLDESAFCIYCRTTKDITALL